MPRALRRLPAGQEIASSVNAAHCNAAKLAFMGSLLPTFPVGRYSLLCDKDGERKLLLSRCFPVFFTLMGEREEGKNNCSVLFDKGCLRRPEWGGFVAAPLRAWLGLQIQGTESTCQIIHGKSGSICVLN